MRGGKTPPLAPAPTPADEPKRRRRTFLGRRRRFRRRRPRHPRRRAGTTRPREIVSAGRPGRPSRPRRPRPPRQEGDVVVRRQLEQHGPRRKPGARDAPATARPRRRRRGAGARTPRACAPRRARPTAGRGSPGRAADGVRQAQPSPSSVSSSAVARATSPRRISAGTPAAAVVVPRELAARRVELDAGDAAARAQGPREADDVAADAGAAVADLAVRARRAAPKRLRDPVGGSRVGDAVDRHAVQKHVLARVVGALRAPKSWKRLPAETSAALCLAAALTGGCSAILVVCAALRGLGALFVCSRQAFFRSLWAQNLEM